MTLSFAPSTPKSRAKAAALASAIATTSSAISAARFSGAACCLSPWGVSPDDGSRFIRPSSLRFGRHRWRTWGAGLICDAWFVGMPGLRAAPQNGSLDVASRAKSMENAAFAKAPSAAAPASGDPRGRETRRQYRSLQYFIQGTFMTPFDDRAELSGETPGFTERLRIAVIGSGISGLSAAWLLSSRHHVTVFEKETRPGGHSNTIVADCPEGPVPVDTGLHRLQRAELSEPDGAVPASRCRDAGEQHVLRGVARNRVQTPLRIFGLRAQRHLCRPSQYRVRSGLWRMIGEIVRLYRAAPDLALQTGLDEKPLGVFLREQGYFGSAARRPSAADVRGDLVAAARACGTVSGACLSAFLRQSRSDAPQGPSGLADRRGRIARICPQADGSARGTDQARRGRRDGAPRRDWRAGARRQRRMREVRSCGDRGA